jgi:hypothetical protein
LSALIAAASGAPREPAPEAVARLEARLRAPDFAGASLGGARLARLGDRIEIGRDPGALLGRAGAPGVAPLPLPVGVETVWDGRLALLAQEQGLVVAARSHGVTITGGAGETPVKETPNVAAHWLLQERIAHLLGERG